MQWTEEQIRNFLPNNFKTTYSQKEEEMKRVYVAGSYSAPNVTEVLDNMRRGMRKSVEVLLAGFSPFCPWLDFHFQLMLREGEGLTVEDYYQYSMSWLGVSDAVLVLPNFENSKGTKAEIARAKERGIPVFYDLEELKNAYSRKGN